MYLLQSFSTLKPQLFLILETSIAQTLQVHVHSPVAHTSLNLIPFQDISLQWYQH